MTDVICNIIFCAPRKTLKGFLPGLVWRCWHQKEVIILSQAFDSTHKAAHLNRGRRAENEDQIISEKSNFKVD